MDIIIDLAILIITLILGVPVPFCFMAAVLYMMVISGGFSQIFLMSNGFNSINSLAVICILYFILMGGIMSSGGIAERLVAISDSILGKTKSGIGTVAVVSSAIFGAIAGTSSAAVAAIGTIMIPRMVERGYPRNHATALISAASVESQLIPPSVPMILYAWVTWQSVAACFLSTVVPGIMMVISYSVVNWIMIRKYPIKVLPPSSAKKQIKDFGSAIITSPREAKLAVVPPVVGFVKREIKGKRASLSLYKAALVLAICIKPIIASCIRTPPDALEIITGNFFSIAVSISRVIFSPTTEPIVPPM